MQSLRREEATRLQPRAAMARQVFRWRSNKLPRRRLKSTALDKPVAAGVAERSAGILKLPTTPKGEKIRAAETISEMPNESFPTARDKRGRSHPARRSHARPSPGRRQIPTSPQDTPGIGSGQQGCTSRRSSACHEIHGYRLKAVSDKTRCDVHCAETKASSMEAGDEERLQLRLFPSTHPRKEPGNARLQSAL